MQITGTLLVPIVMRGHVANGGLRPSDQAVGTESVGQSLCPGALRSCDGATQELSQNGLGYAVQRYGGSNTRTTSLSAICEPMSVWIRFTSPMLHIAHTYGSRTHVTKDKKCGVSVELKGPFILFF